MLFILTMSKASTNSQKTATNKNSKKPASKKSVTKNKVEPVEETPVEETPVDESFDESQDKSSETKPLSKKKTIPTFKFEGSPEDVQNQINEMLKNMTETQKEVNSNFTLYKHFLNDMGKKLVAARKNEEKVRSKQEKRKSRNHLSPVFKISPKLAEFMGVDQEKGACRTNALGFISKYVRDNKLNGHIEVDDGKGGKKVDGRLIELDDKLSELFPNLVESGEYLQFTSILTHLNKNNHIGAKIDVQKSSSNSETEVEA